MLASRALGRIGYEELLSHTAEAARAMLAADAVYLLAPGEDGELRVRAAAGAGRSGAADLGPLATGTGAGAQPPPVTSRKPRSLWSRSPSWPTDG